MADSNRFSLAIETMAKLADEMNTIHSSPQPALPTLNDVLSQFAPLPHAALFLGLADDGLPILLNLLDPLPGPIMIIGDEGCGKTNFLKTISSSVDRTQPSNKVNYLVLTDNTSEWVDFKNSTNCADVLSSNESEVSSHLHALTEWAHSNRGEEQIHLLMVDRLDALIAQPETQQDLRWLLLRGPSKRIWPIVTINSTVAASESYRLWLSAFRTRLFGYINDDHKTGILTGGAHTSFNNLISGFQFAMREGNKWLPFWIPPLE